MGVLVGLSACGGSTTSNGGNGGRSAAGNGGQSATGGHATVGSGGQPASTGGMGGTGEARCSEPNPAGCVVNACPPSFRCDQTVGCNSSSCACTAEGWACDDDCGGGTCVPLEDPGQPSTCEALTTGLTAELAMELGPNARTGTCTAVVRLDYTSLAVLGHTFVCGPYGGVTEAMARARADADATFPEAQGAGHGQLLLDGGTAGAEWIFYQSPSDFGGASAVSARSGLTVFAGSIVWAGTGNLMVPDRWNTTALGRGCAPVTVPIRGFDLRSGAPLATDQSNAAARVVLESALPPAMTKFGGVFDAIVLLYPRTVGSFDPKRAEYIVLLNGGALIGD